MGLQPEMSLMREAKVAPAPGKGGAGRDFTVCVLLTPPSVAWTSSVVPNFLFQSPTCSSSLLLRGLHLAPSRTPSSAAQPLSAAEVSFLTQFAEGAADTPAFRGWERGTTSFGGHRKWL